MHTKEESASTIRLRRAEVGAATLSLATLLSWGSILVCAVGGLGEFSADGSSLDREIKGLSKGFLGLIDAGELDESHTGL